MRLLYRLRVAFKRWLVKRMAIIEYCRDCGVRQPLVWIADDTLWEQVWGKSGGGGILCPECFDRRAERLGLFIRWCPMVERSGVVKVGEGEALAQTEAAVEVTAA